MPITIACSQCDKKLKVPDNLVGKKVKCPSCQAIIQVPAADEGDAPPEDEGVTKRPASRPAPARSSEDEDESEPRPRRRRQEADEDEEGMTDERPSRRRAADD